MIESLDQKERQNTYDYEQAKIGKFSGLLSASCKFAWAGSLAIFFSSFISADNATLARMQSVFFVLRLSALFGALAFLAEIIQYFLGYIFACNFSKWLESAESITRDEVSAYRNKLPAKANVWLFYLKVCCAILSAGLLVIGTAMVSLQRMPI